jgi:TRAP-type C4-dicarboxylate transport system permease small subunit
MIGFDKILRWISHKGNILGAIVLLSLMVLISANVVYRLFGSTIVATFDLVELLIVVVVAFALPYAAVEGFHTMVTILTSRMPERLAAIFRTATALASFCFCAMVTWQSALLTIENSRVGEVTEVTGLSIIPFRWIWTFGFGLVSLILIRDVLNSFLRALHK